MSSLRSKFVALATAAACAFYCSAASARFDYVTEGEGKPLLVFVPGAWGDRTSFTAPGSKKSWAELMRGDWVTFRSGPKLADFATAILTFPSGCRDRLSIPQIAQGLALDLRDKEVWTKHPKIIFIGHSLGGLAIQEMLSVDREDLGGVNLVDRTAGVVLLATPTNGSQLAAYISDAIAPLVGPSTDCQLLRDLRSMNENAYLQKLDDQWRKFIERQVKLRGNKRLQVKCFYETKPTRGSVIVPMDQSATQCDGERAAIAADHIEIAKPESIDAEVYNRVRGRIMDIYLHGEKVSVYSRQAMMAKPGNYIKGEGYKISKSSAPQLCADLCAEDRECQASEYVKDSTDCGLFKHQMHQAIPPHKPRDNATIWLKVN